MAIGIGKALAGGAILGGLIQGGTSIANTVLNQKNFDKTMEFNRIEAEKNRQFQREMAQSNILNAVKQANELGISPSLVLGDQTNALGGSQASVGNAPTANMTGVGQIANILQEQLKLKTLEEMNEDKLNTMKDIQIMKNSASTTAKKTQTHNYSQKELNDLYDDIRRVEL